MKESSLETSESETACGVVTSTELSVVSGLDCKAGSRFSSSEICSSDVPVTQSGKSTWEKWVFTESETYQAVYL